MFSKVEINRLFLKKFEPLVQDLIKRSSSSSLRFGTQLDLDIWFLLQLRQSSSPTRAGFGCTIGLGSRLLDKAITGKDYKMPSIHVGEDYIQNNRSHGSISDEAWISMSDSSHVDEQVLHLANASRSKLAEWTILLQDVGMTELLRWRGNPWFYETWLKLHSIEPPVQR
jgi:hypothetical protein